MRMTFSDKMAGRIYNKKNTKIICNLRNRNKERQSTGTTYSGQYCT